MTDQELYLDRLKKMQETVKKIKAVDSSKIVLPQRKVERKQIAFK
jgi:hypothetical protein